MTNKFIIAFIISFLIQFVGSYGQAAAKEILYIPLDNRPVCLDYSVETLAAAGWEVKVPPIEYIADNKRNGNPDLLYKWLSENIRKAEAAVISADAMLYGGLVASRTHNCSEDVLNERVQRLLALKQSAKLTKLYIFSTIMRSPKYSAAPVEPDYYSEWGNKIFRMGALEDKRELGVLRRKERKELELLWPELPGAIKRDYYNRRALNLRMTQALLNGVPNGSFDYFLIGRDDTAAYSQAHREARQMANLVNEFPKEKIRFFAGADQLGLILLNRAVYRIDCGVPMVYLEYAEGVGKDTKPSYEDDKIDVTARQHILAAGGWVTKKPERADLVLMINTPQDGITKEATSKENEGILTEKHKQFLSEVSDNVKHGRSVALADIAYGNGADQALIKGLLQSNYGFGISSYAGWNTASNSLGYALAQGLLSTKMSEEDKTALLTVRYLDDWAYQANVRERVATELIWPNRWNYSKLTEEQTALAEEKISLYIKELTKEIFKDKVMEGYRFELPWKRMFEVRVSKNMACVDGFTQADEADGEVHD